MSAKFVVLVSDRDEKKHGEVIVLDSPGQAQRLVETLLEAGFEQERIRLFSGGELQMVVTHRPVVNLMSDGAGDRDALEPARAEEHAEPAVQDAADGSGPAELEAPETPFVLNGVKFSSLFRTDAVDAPRAT